MLLNKFISSLALGLCILNASFNYTMPDKNINDPKFLVNNENMISKKYKPELITTNIAGDSHQLQKEASDALQEMFKEAKGNGYNLSVKSAFREYSNQKSIYNRKLNRSNSAMEYSALPGASEHQLGLAADIISDKFFNLHPDFGRTNEGIWLKENAHKFGFIIRYTTEYEHVTKIKYEPWHIRYVGIDTAKEIFNLNNIPLEWYSSSMRLNLYKELLSTGY